MGIDDIGMISKHRTMEKSKKLILFKSVFQFQGFIGPVLFLFYTRYMGLTSSEYFLIDSILFVTKAVFEIPSGYIADRFGRKRMLIISKIIIILGMLILVLSKNFAGALLVSFIYGFFGAMESGVAESIIYEQFLDDKEELQNILSKANSISFTVALFYSFLSGLLMKINSSYPIKGDIAISIILLTLYWILLEDHRDYKSNFNKKFIFSKIEFKNYFPMMIVASILLASSRIFFSFYQPVYTEMNLSPVFFGVLSASYSITAALSSSLYSKKIKKGVAINKILKMLILFHIISTFGMLVYPEFYVFIFIFMQQITRGIMGPFLFMEINSYIKPDSKMRVTYSSIFYFTNTMLVAVILSFSSLMTSYFEVRGALFFTCIAMNLLLLLAYASFKKKLTMQLINKY